MDDFAFTNYKPNTKREAKNYTNKFIKELTINYSANFARDYLKGLDRCSECGLKIITDAGVTKGEHSTCSLECFNEHFRDEKEDFQRPCEFYDVVFGSKRG